MTRYLMTDLRDHMEDRISELNSRNLEIIQVEEERELRSFLKRRNSMRTIRAHYKGQHKDNGYPRRRKEGEGSREFI